MIESPKEYRRWTEGLAELTRGAQPTSDCPDPELLWSLTQCEPSAARRRALVDHTAGCPSCRRAMALARELSAQVEKKEAAAPVLPVASIKRRVVVWVAAAAAVAIVVVVGDRIDTRTDRTQGSEYRVSEENELASLLDESIPLPRDHCILRWTPAGPGARYTIRVATVGLDLIARETALEQEQFQVPASALQALPAGANLVWTVRAQLPDGAIVTSPTFVNRLQ